MESKPADLLTADIYCGQMHLQMEAFLGPDLAAQNVTLSLDQDTFKMLVELAREKGLFNRPAMSHKERSSALVITSKLEDNHE